MPAPYPRNTRFLIGGLLLVLLAVAVTYVVMVNTRPAGTAIVQPNQPVELVQFKTLPAERGQLANVLFTVARPVRGQVLRGTVLVPKPFAVVDRSLPTNTLVYSVADYEGRSLAVVRYHPRTTVAARGGPRIAPDPGMNMALRTSR